MLNDPINLIDPLGTDPKPAAPSKPSEFIKQHPHFDPSKWPGDWSRGSDRERKIGDLCEKYEKESDKKKKEEQKKMLEAELAKTREDLKKAIELRKNGGGWTQQDWQIAADPEIQSLRDQEALLDLALR